MPRPYSDDLFAGLGGPAAQPARRRTYGDDLFAGLSGEPEAEQGDDTPWYDTAIATGLRVVPGIAGGLVNTLTGGGAGLGAAIGAGAAGAGETAAQAYEIARGMGRTEMNPTQVALQTGLGAVPGMGLANSLKGFGGIAARTALNTGYGAVVGGATNPIVERVEEQGFAGLDPVAAAQDPQLVERVQRGMGWGAAFGAGGSLMGEGVHALATRRAAARAAEIEGGFDPSFDSRRIDEPPPPDVPPSEPPAPPPAPPPPAEPPGVLPPPIPQPALGEVPAPIPPPFSAPPPPMPGAPEAPGATPLRRASRGYADEFDEAAPVAAPPPADLTADPEIARMLAEADALDAQANAPAPPPATPEDELTRLMREAGVTDEQLATVTEEPELVGVGVNASGESEASAEAISRLAGMTARGERFAVRTRAGYRDLVGPEAVDYRVKPNEEYGIVDADGNFRPLDRGENAPTTPAPRAPRIRAEGARVGTVAPDAAEPGGVYRMAPTDLEIRPREMQYKGNADDQGVTQEGRIQGPWDRNAEGVILAWKDPATGRLVVVNGHHRVEAAKRLGVSDLTVRVIEGVEDAAGARAVGALTNIKEERGTPVDVAKLIRDGGFTPQMFREAGIPANSKLSRLGFSLSKLQDGIFGRVAQGELDPEIAAAIAGGDRPLSPEGQNAVLAIYERNKNRPQPRELTPAQVSNVVDEVRAAQEVTAAADAQKNLFGDEEFQNTAVEKADLRDWIRKQIAGERRDFGAVGKRARAERVAEAGNTLAVDENARRAQIAAEELEVLEKIGASRGPLNDALEVAATRILQGEKPDAVRKELLAVARATIQAERGRTAAAATEPRIPFEGDRSGAGDQSTVRPDDGSPAPGAENRPEAGAPGPARLAPETGGEPSAGRPVDAYDALQAEIDAIEDAWKQRTGRIPTPDEIEADPVLSDLYRRRQQVGDEQLNESYSAIDRAIEETGLAPDERAAVLAEVYQLNRPGAGGLDQYFASTYFERFAKDPAGSATKILQLLLRRRFPQQFAEVDDYRQMARAVGREAFEKAREDAARTAGAVARYFDDDAGAPPAPPTAPAPPAAPRRRPASTPADMKPGDTVVQASSIVPPSRTRIATPAERAVIFTPGNEVLSYDGVDKVISYQPPDANGRWSVTVQRAGEAPRTHSTEPMVVKPEFVGAYGKQSKNFRVPDADPLVDLLDTGEGQARLPGDVGDVRNVENPTPKDEAPFSLENEIGQRSELQDDLFGPGERGRVQLGALAPAAGALTGAATGAATADEDATWQERAARAGLGAIAGAGIGFAGARGAQAIAGRGGRGRPVTATEQGRAEAPESPRPPRRRGTAERPASDDLLDIDRFEKYADELGTEDAMRAAAREISPQEVAAWKGVSTDEMMRQAASELDLTADEMRRIQGSVADIRERVMAMRAINKGAFQQARSAADAVRANPNDAQAIARFNAALDGWLGVQRSFTGARAEAGRFLRDFRQMAIEGMSPEQLQDVVDIVGDARQRDRLVAIAEGLQSLDPNDLRRANRFVSEAKKATTAEKVHRIWLNFLLSSPKTHAANFISTGLASLTQPLDRTMGGLLDLVRAKGSARPQERFVREGAYSVVGMLNGIVPGLRAALKTQLTGESRFSAKQSRGGDVIGTTTSTTARGGLGRVEPIRFLQSADEFWKTVVESGDLHARAIRQALREGKKGRDIGGRVAEILDNPGQLRQEAQKEALYRTFNAEPGQIGKKLIGLRKDVPGAAKVFPFLTTPINIAKFGVQHTPIYAGKILADIGRGRYQGRSGELVDELAKVATGSLLATAVGAMYLQGRITGGQRPDRAGHAMDVAVRPDYSVKLGDNWYAYNRLEPLGMTMGLVADFMELQKQDDNQVGKIIYSFARNLGSKTFLQSAADLMEAMTDPDGYKRDRFLSNLGGSVVPTVIADIARTVDPVQRRTRGIGERIRQRTPGMSEDLRPVTNVFGEVVSEGHVGAFERMVSPVRRRPAKEDPLVDELNRLGIALDVPSDKLTIKRGEMSDAEKSALVQAKGKATRRAIERRISSARYQQADDDRKTKLVKDAIDDARDRVTRRARVRKNTGQELTLEALLGVQ